MLTTIVRVPLLRLSMLLVLAASSAFGATLSGTVRDSEGATVSNAHIIVHWDSSGSRSLHDNLGIKRDITATSDLKGRYSLELPPGFYDVFVSATAFSPRSTKLRLKANDVKTYDVKLEISSVVVNELGDHF